MNVYDFDNTIYQGESTFDFYLFTVKRQPELISYFFVVIKTLIKYKLCLLDKEEFIRLAEKYAADYLSKLKDRDETVRAFWNKNECKIKSFYLKQKRADDVIISATPDFLLRELFSRLDIQNYIATKIHLESGKIIEACFQSNKVTLFKEKFPDASIDAFYTDSKNDLPIMCLAKKAYMVKGNRVELVDLKK